MAVFAGVELTELVLSGPRLTLRPWRPEDAETAYRALREDEEAHRFTTVPWPYTREVAQEWAGALANAGRLDGSELAGALVETATGIQVGSAALRLHGSGEIGYLVYREHRGRGYAAEATRMLIDWAFEHGLVRVELACDVRNLASVHTALRAGMSFEGVSCSVPLLPRVPDRITDLARFARLSGAGGDPIPPRFAALPAGGLTDGVVRVRMLAPEDAQGYETTGDAVAIGWSFDGTWIAPDEVRRRCLHAGLQWLVGSTAAMAIVDERTGRYAGDISLRQAGPPQVGEFGYAVHPDFRGRGYTTRALRLVTAWAFETGGFVRLELGAKAGNVASQKAASNAGYQSDGVAAARLRNPDGSFSDEVRFALLNPSGPTATTSR